VPVSKQAEAIAKRQKKADAAKIQRVLLDPWRVAVIGTPDSDALQKIAARTFGFPDPKGLEELKIDWDMLYPMGELYNETQDRLKAKGYQEQQTLPVYHPYIPKDAVPKQWKKGQQVRIFLLPLTSWTTDMQEAATFAAFFGTAGNPGFVLKTFIPVKSIVSTPATGMGIPGTHEVVLAGGEYEALVEAKFG
jgi:hypothetical protein